MKVWKMLLTFLVAMMMGMLLHITAFPDDVLRIFLSQKLSTSIGKEPMHKLLRSKVPYDGRGHRSVLS
jgi:hypothetical protein